MGKLAPVVLFAYNRLDKTKNLIESLEKCELSKKTDLYIFLDAPKEHRKKDRIEVEKVGNYLDDLEVKQKDFLSVKVFKAAAHKGLAKSVIDGVSIVIKRHKKVIVLEDDLVLSSNFLIYMNQALTYYKYNKRIWSVTGYTPPLKCLEKKTQNVYFTYRGSSWGWGTWINRWKMVDWEVKDYKNFVWNIYKQWKFNRGGNDLSSMLMNYMKGKNDSWAVRWCYEASKHNLLTVYPTRTMVRNEGFDGSGTHCSRHSVEPRELDNETKNFVMEEVFLDRSVLRESKQYYKISTKEWLTYYISNLFGY